MRRLLSALAGAAMLLAPGLFLFDTLVPVPEYRAGTFADFAAAAASCLTLYGGVAIGALLMWRRRSPARPPAGAVFRAGFLGGVAAAGAAIAGRTLLQWTAGGRVSVGNLWGLAVIFGAALSAMIAGGAALIWFALIRPRGSPTGRP